MFVARKLSHNTDTLEIPSNKYETGKVKIIR